MAKLAEIGGVPGNVLGMLSDLTHKLQHGAITPRELELFVKRQNPFAGPEVCLEEQFRFYRDVFSVDPGIDGVVIPPDRPGFEWIVVATPVVPTNEIVRTHQKLWNFWSCYGKDLETEIPTNERTYANGAYAIRVRPRIEADEELMSKSALDIQQMRIATTTCDERLRLELWHAWKTGKGNPKRGKHLDVSNVTLCSGSRRSGGVVPGVDWLGGKLLVGWYLPSDASSLLRAREVVSAA